MAAWRKDYRFVDPAQVFEAVRNGQHIYWGNKLRNPKSMLDETLRVVIVATAMGELWSVTEDKEQ